MWLAARNRIRRRLQDRLTRRESGSRDRGVCVNRSRIDGDRLGADIDVWCRGGGDLRRFDHHSTYQPSTISNSHYHIRTTNGRYEVRYSGAAAGLWIFIGKFNSESGVSTVCYDDWRRGRWGGGEGEVGAGSVKRSPSGLRKKGQVDKAYIGRG